MKWTFVPALLAVIGFPTFFQEKKKQERKPTAAEITAKVMNVYSSCDTYRDSCAVRIVVPEHNSGVEFQAVAKTAYQRGGVFRFQFGAPPKEDNGEPEVRVPSEVVWADGKQFKMRHGLNLGGQIRESTKIGTHADVRSWLGGMVLHTFESSSEIPLLVLPVGNSRVLPHFQVNRCNLQELEVVDGRSCYVLAESIAAINGKNNQPMTLSHRYWIDQKKILDSTHSF